MMRGEATNEAPESADGRVRRGERSREAIVSALFELIADGVPRPTAPQIAEKAKVDIRAVMESSRKALLAR
jgi:hypothetical protein